MKNLFEELQRIKSLMVYDSTSNINEVSTASVQGVSSKPAETKTNDSNKSTETKPEPTTDLKKPAEKSSDTKCIFVTNTETYKTDNDVNTEVPTKFKNRFIEMVEKEFGSMTNGELTIEDVNVFGGASNFYGSAVEPDYCNEYDTTKGTSSLQKWSSSCKGYDAKKKYTNSGGSTKNRDLAYRRAEKVKKELLIKLKEASVEREVKFDEAKILKEIKDSKSGSIYTKDLTDTHKSISNEIKAGTLKNGQFVMIDAKVCFKSYDPCPNCMIRDPQTKKCKCKEGLTEKDGKCFCPNGKEADENCECNSCPDPCMTFNKETKKCDCPEGMTFNESTKQCECPKGSNKTENCKCEKGKEEPCPDKCMKRDEDGKCKCPDGMKYNEETKVCDCPEGKVKPIEGACNCVTPKPPIKCNSSTKKEGGRGTKQNNFVAASLDSSFPVGEGDTVTISFDSLVVPDAFYLKYGDQEFFSGFMGDIYNVEYKQVALSITEKKKMLPLQSKLIKQYVQDSLSKGDNDYSDMDNTVRNFVGELITYKREDGLLESINSAIKSKGGKLNVTDIFKNGDSEAEKITDEIIKTGNIKDNIVKYKGIMKSGTSFKITKENENFNVIVLAFSPLERTIFNMEVKCE
jgi:hypothetical protein